MLIIPQENELTRPYWEAARQHRLVIQKCNACGHRWHPPLPICPACHAKDYTWTPVSGRGVVYSYTVVHHPAHVAVADKVPYVVILVDLEEGPRVVSNIRNCDPEALAVGMPVSLIFEEIAEGVVLPQFEPATAQAGGKE